MGQRAHPAGRRDQAHQRGQPEHRPPAERAGQRTAEHRADRDRGGADRAPGRQRPGPLGRAAGGRADDGQCGRAEQRAADALHQPPEHQGLRRARGGAAERPEREQRHPEHERQPRPEPVGGVPAEQQAAAERQAVAVDHPGQSAPGEAEVAAQRRQRDDHDRGVGEHDEVCQRGGQHDRPHRGHPPASGSRCPTPPPAIRSSVPTSRSPSAASDEPG